MVRGQAEVNRMDPAIEAAAGRAQSYWLLSRLFLEQPGDDLLHALSAALAGPDVDLSRPGIADLQRAVQAARAAPGALLELQVEFTRLLGSAGGAVQAPQPYESVALDGRLFGESAESVAAAYLDAGCEALATDAGPPDHVSNELRFLSVLCYREMQAWQRGDEDAASQALAQQHDFLQQHVLAWVPDYCERIAQATPHPFYLAVAQLTSDALRLERDDMALVHGIA